MRYIIILNEEAGKAGQTAPGSAPEELSAAFAAAGIEADVRLAAPGEIEATLQGAVESRPDAVIIGGGDGTVRSAAAALADTGIPLGVLPLGTFNHFAKDLKMPLEVKEAVAVLAGGAAREVDLGEVNGHVFINNCSIGAYAEAVRRRETLQNRHGVAKWWAMWRASFQEFRRLRRLRLRIKTTTEGRGQTSEDRSPSRPVGGVLHPDPDSTSRHKAAPTFRNKNLEPGTQNPTASRPVRTPVVVVGNNRYSGHLLSQHLRPRLDEGRLWLYTVHARRHGEVLRMMLQALCGQLDDADALAAEPATEIVIESDCGPLPVAADGEVLKLTAPLHFRIRPGALRVIAPVEAEKSSREAAKTAKEDEPALAGGVLHPDSDSTSRA